MVGFSIYLHYLYFKGKDLTPLDEVLSMLLKSGRSDYSRLFDLYKVKVGFGGGGGLSMHMSHGTSGYGALC